MSDRRLARLGVAAAFLYLLLSVVAIFVASLNGDIGSAIGFPAALSGFTIVGGVLTSRRPRNPIGWLFLTAAVAGAANVLCASLSVYGVVTAPGSIPFGPFVGTWLAVFFGNDVLALLVVSVFLFPSGRLPSRRWRPVAFGVGLFFLAVMVLFVFGTPTTNPRYPQIVNPFVVPALVPITRAVNEAFYLYVFLLALAVASLVARYGAGRAAEKQQLKWILLAAVLMVASLGASSIAPLLVGAALYFSLLVLPTAVGIAILRYRLFDIDHLISRTLVYGATTGVIAALFFGGIVALQPVLRPLTAGTDLAVAASTLVAFALFQPIRRRLQNGVDRRFDRSRYDAARTLDAFSDELRDEVDLERVQADLLATVSTTMAPQHVSLWLRRGMPGMGSNTVTISGRPVVRKELA